MYTFEYISRFFIESVPGITLRLNLYGLAEFNVPETIGYIELDEQLHRLLGFNKKRSGLNIIGKYVGDVPVNYLYTSGFTFISTNSRQPLILLMVHPQPCLR